MAKYLKYGGIQTAKMKNPFGKIFGANVSSKGWILFLVISVAFLYYMLVIRRRK